MTDDLWPLLATIGVVMAFGAVPLAGWLFGKGRQPCPHCGRKAGRTVRDVHSIIGGLGPRDLTYACNSCGGAQRYARRPNGQEFWEPIDGPSPTAS